MWRWAIVTGGLVLVAVVLVVVNRDSGSTVPKGPPGTQTFDVASRNHVTEPVNYPQSPPVGGNHAPIWQTCGYYSQPIPNERGVHVLEHGGVWITYRPSLPPAEVDQLRVVAADPYTLVSPFKDLSAAVVASGWGKQIRLSSTKDHRLQQFIDDFRQGPQTPEPGARCTGGVGVPE